MVPGHVMKYLEEHRVPYRLRPHPRAVEAQHLAEAVAESGWRVAKGVLVEVDGETWIAVLPASERVDPYRLADAINAREVRILGEQELEGRFSDCELGAEPPFGGLYGLKVVMEAKLTEEEKLLVRAGSHEECVELDCIDFLELESPIIASFGVLPSFVHAQEEREARA